MNAAISHALVTLPILTIKITLLLLVVWGGSSLLLRKSSASLRHLVWSAALIGVIAMPVLCMTLPRLNFALKRPVTPIALPAPKAVVVSAFRQPSSAVISKAVIAIPRLRNVDIAEPSRIQPVRPPAAAGTYRLPLVFALPAIWAIGFLAVLAQFSIGLRRITRIGRLAASPDEVTTGIAEQVRMRLQVRPVRLLVAAECIDVAVPMTWGTLLPVVILPPQSREWSEDCLRAALLHEMAHVKRWDWATLAISRFACALYWWHPAVWLAAKQAREEAERACDDIAMEAGMKATDYAQKLVDVIRSIPQGSNARTAAIAMARPSEMEGRLQAILARGRSRSPVRRRWIAAAAVTASLMLPLLASLQPVVQGQPIARRVALAAPLRVISLQTADRALPQVAAVKSRRPRAPRSVAALPAHVMDATGAKTIPDKMALHAPLQNLILPTPMSAIVEQFAASISGGHPVNANTPTPGGLLARTLPGTAKRGVSAASGLPGASLPASQHQQMTSGKATVKAGNGALPQAPISATRNALTPVPSPSPASMDVDASLVEAQDRLRRATAGYQSGINPQTDVYDAEIAVAEAQIRSSVARSEYTDLKPKLEDLLKQRLQLLTNAQARFAVGLSPRGDVNEARAALDAVRVRMNLYDIVTIRASDLADVTARYNSGAGTSEEKDRAETVLQKAELAFIDSGDR